jgi:CBS-domain-containing membrane protein
LLAFALVTAVLGVYLGHDLELRNVVIGSAVAVAGPILAQYLWRRFYPHRLLLLVAMVRASTWPPGTYRVNFAVSGDDAFAAQEALDGAGFDYVEDPVNAANGGTLIRARIQLKPAEGFDVQEARDLAEGALAEHRIRGEWLHAEGPT